MLFSSLTAVSPIDGRYHNTTETLANYFSEYALIRYRVKVEIAYFIALAKLPLPQLKSVSEQQLQQLLKIEEEFSENDAAHIKEIEKTTNHDVKAVEYFLKEKFDQLGLKEVKEFIHFGLTSQDINNTATPLSLKEAWEEVLAPQIVQVTSLLREKAISWENVPMLARTHGQPASPTRLGKELYVFVDRIKEQLSLLSSIPFSAKFGGATGNFNAHVAAYSHVDWIEFANRFVTDSLGLKRSQVTTQIDHYDHMAAFFDALKRINTIFIDLDRDVWTYISMNYFRQKIKKGEVGSSAMPHKVNPIDFENSEGNFGIANAVFEHLSAKLPISRLQRDLTDSTVSRNIGVPIAHMMIGLKSLERGLHKLILAEDVVQADLEANWVVVAEGIQTILRREGFPEPYEVLKELTRTNQVIDKETIAVFVEKLDVSGSVKKELLTLSPQTYVGIFKV